MITIDFKVPVSICIKNREEWEALATERGIRFDVGNVICFYDFKNKQYVIRQDLPIDNVL